MTMATRFLPLGSVSSWRTTVSAPAGSGAPVKIRVASPGPSGLVGKRPAGTVSTTCNSARVRPATSMLRTA
ncbi:MAG: hypothetical protein AUG10_03715 [Gemmatimonadetes bacterium 13_1_20CM_2_70_10]|nr:MAG: hypothetical protein AUG10_03715 [Gemmatimonadetes bacterium 13_1_20CM_2_70_10]